ncbi:acetyltransferase [Mycobacterium gordonae]|uniref:GNAT family N-acetyltransferase n=1 Tax=Mycobacterium gordonae TaxID=1778 RepID=UPI00210D973F|nr:GNAT family N-acetyltransferase [Mycobacterium gordonae]MCQ4362116.1 acetyltransferase [Mycobacterium gordonae]
MTEATSVDPTDLLRRCATPERDGLPGTFTLRLLDPDGDLDVLHSWMNDPEVARYWKKAWPREQIAAYLREQQLSSHSTPYVGELNGVPMSYWELYRADLDPLAQYYDAREHDAGVHLLLGPTDCRGRRLGADLLRVVSAWQLDADPLATRVIGEPDASNVRLIRVATLAGFRHVADIDLPHKRAALIIRTRDSL